MRCLKTKYSNIEIKGKRFNNLTEACKYFKVSYGFISSRIHRKGMSIEQAFSIPVKDYNIKVGNKSFKSILSACKIMKFTPENIYYRLSKEWTLDEAFEIIPRQNTTKCKGIVYKISNSRNKKVYIGITVLNLNIRFNRHKTDAQAGSSIKIHKAMRKYGIENFRIKIIKKVHCRKDLAKEEVRLIKKYNSIENGYNTRPGGSSNGENHGKPITYRGIDFISHSLLADYLGLSTSALQWRIKNDLPLDEKIGKGGTRGNKILYRGKIYKSIKHLGEHLGLSKSGIHYRLKMGYCLNGPPEKTGQEGYYKGELV